MELFCRDNDQLVAEIKASIRSRSKNGYQIVWHEQAIDSQNNPVNVYGAGDPDTTKMKFM